MRDAEKVRAATAAVAYAAGEHGTVTEAAEAHGAGYEDIKNLLKKWRKEGSLPSHLAAY